ncbi:hypothetical protein ColTof4_06370 [Colletotrichum tofieldiae]|uniref:Uncharacterized protein n=1 Tax=Colletotrichum tofieldiae TaxID=708197 RepID=A0A166TW30_9PEZI|nr:hypothetical protein CT0861_09389 [Colletotrichum tofieldiae]GKT54218.1 hypothetical protein ColTof3_01557 [Colletotrichum tofieldiae]GKT73947.1 hypothetical protein ColTof4_06370 [Colletotrichum tofieldiae]GKT95919.1 hypothetical protein Ct61P_13769 [Colletotrichum tofieldiae]
MAKHHYQDECASEFPGSQPSQSSQDSENSAGSDDTVDEEYTVWGATRTGFEAWADDRMRRRCRWQCCRCRFVNRMPWSRLAMMHCRNPRLPSEGGDCPRDKAGETHSGPGECCVILVPRGVDSASDGE